MFLISNASKIFWRRDLETKFCILVMPVICFDKKIIASN